MSELTEIKRQGHARLVQLDSGKRVILPIGEDDASLGIHYGLPWEEITESAGLAQELRLRGYYTLEDVHKNPNKIAPLARAHGQDYFDILAKARAYGGNDNA